MILGVGTDILDSRRLLPAYLRETDPFFRAAFTEREIAQARERGSPKEYFATRFAGKEAVFKALRISPDEIRRGAQIEILDDSRGAPSCQVAEELLAAAGAQGAGVHISLSWDGDLAVAFAVLESKN